LLKCATELEYLNICPVRKQLLIIVSEDENRFPVKHYLLDLSPCMHGEQAGQLTGGKEIPESDILDFSVSLNPLGSPFRYEGSGLDMDSLLEKAVRKLEQYPDNRYFELRSAASRFIGSDAGPDNIVPGNGSCELFRLILECVADAGDMVIVPIPCPAEYYRTCEALGAVPHKVRLHEMLHLPKRTLEKAKVIFFSNPNNPTGELVSRDRIREFAIRCAEQGTLLVVDESFIELSDPSQSIAELAANNDHLLVIRSIVNAFSLPGIRFSYAVTSAPMASRLNAARLSWNIGAVTEEIAGAVLGMEGGANSDYLVRSRNFIREERQYISDRLSSLYGFNPLKSSANFILVNMEEHFMDSERFAKCFASRGIFVRECSDFFEGQKHFIRIAVCSRYDFEKLISKLDEVYAESSREEAREKLEETLEQGPERIAATRGTCGYYPCHFLGQDCTFCFCPFYACNDERTGGKWIDSATGGKVWSCEHCTLLHQPQVAEKILDVLMEDGDTDENIRKAWAELVLPLL
jgi:threonine-phosphate decarboxylase